MSTLQRAADALYDLAAELPFNRAGLIADANDLEAMAGDDQTMIAAAASIRDLVNSPPDIDPSKQKRAALVATYLRGLAE